MKRDKIILIFALFIFIGLFLISKQAPFQLGGNTIVDTEAVLQTASVNITIKSCAEGFITPGNATYLNATFTAPCFSPYIPLITSLYENWTINLTVYTASFPPDWTEPQPTASESGAKMRYFEVNVSNTTEGSFQIYFNVPQSDLGTITPGNIRLFVYETNWTELSTAVVNSTSDPVKFFATTTHFSKFLIAEKISASESPSSTSTIGSSGGKKKEGIAEQSIEVLPEPFIKPGTFFEASMLIPERYHELYPGEEVVAEVNIINIKKIGLVKVNIEYKIEDMNQSIFFKEVETKAVENEITYLKKLRLSANLQPGVYMLSITVKYQDDVAIAGYPFQVKEPLSIEKPSGMSSLVSGISYLLNQESTNIGILLLIIVIFTLLVYDERRRFKKMEKLIKKTSKKD